MEKLEIVPAPQCSPGQRTLSELFIRPFSRITIQRPLHHFDKALALTPGVASEPSLEVLTRLLTAYPSHKAMLRQHLGEGLLRNLENLVRGKNGPTAGTLTALAEQLDLPPEAILALAHGQKQGPLLPQYLEAMQMAEGFFSLMYGQFTAGSISCPCCGKNVLDDTQVFWHRQTRVRLDITEYLFVERCLATIIGWRLVRGLFSGHGLPTGRCLSSINPDPIDPHQYPVGNWLRAVRDAYRCSDNLDLEKRLAGLPSGSGPTSPVTQPRLNKWACGEDLIPFDIGKSIVQNLPKTRDLGHGLVEARAIAFLQEFVSAAALGTDPPTIEDVRFIVYERVEQFANKLRFNIRHILGAPVSS